MQSPPLVTCGYATKKGLVCQEFYDRKLLYDLSRCAWESLNLFLQDAIPERNPLPGTAIAIQTFGDFLGFPDVSTFLPGRFHVRYNLLAERPDDMFELSLVPVE